MATVRLNPSESGKYPSVFANGANGEKLGRLDLNTGRVYIEDVRFANEVATKLVSWASRYPEKLAPSAVRDLPARDERPWDDLALRRPGQSLEPRVVEERARLRARSRTWAQVDRWILRDEGWAGTWIRGIKGERRVAKVLDRQAKRGVWQVLHSVPLPSGGDIDHLLIGPDGVIAVNTKHHPKAQIAVTPRAIYIRGSRTEYLDEARESARKVAGILTSRLGEPVEVTGCVAIVAGSLLGTKYATHGTPSDVLVATNWNLPRVLWDANSGLTSERVAAIYNVARRSTTWE